MNIDESVLRSYVDGELPFGMRSAVEAAVARRGELQEQLAALRASCLPYRAAFDQYPTPAVPQSLIERISSVDQSGTPAGQPSPAFRRRHWLGAAAVAAAFASGLYTPALWRHATGFGRDDAWVLPIVNYQAMYVRETVEEANEDPRRAQRLLAEFAQRAGASPQVPDLGSAGLEFKRIQRLTEGGKPVMQMVFLPPQGGPVALCVVPVQQADRAVMVRRIDGLGVASWRRGGLGYVLVGDISAEKTSALATGLEHGRFAALHGMQG